MKKILVSILSVVSLLWSTGCEDYLDVNETPNNPLAVTPDVLLPTVLAGAAFVNANALNRFTSTVMQYNYGAAGGPRGYDVYILDGTDFNNQWEFEIYGGALINGRQCITAAEEINGNAYIGISKIMQAYVFALTTDFWGDIPYSEALLGDSAVIQPDLDPQELIYLGGEVDGRTVQSLFDLTREGLSFLGMESAVSPGADDIVYGGDVDLWRRAGNTLLLKLAMQLSEVAPERAQQEIQSVISQGTGGEAVYMTENAHDLNVNFGGSVGSQSPVYSYTNLGIFQNDMALSSRFQTRLEGLNDPRLPIFYTQTEGEYVSFENGFRGSLPNPETYSQFNAYVTGANGEGPVRLLTNFQTKFILAEAALRFGITQAGTAQELYQAGIRASMELAGIEGTAIDAYFAANPNVVTLSGSTEEQLAQIIEQKYIAFTGYGYESWNDFRRTGYPTLPLSLNADGVDGTIPLRVFYTAETITNNENVPSTPPASNVPVWWDVNN
ncbi:SusD/RagB family nutrient-binding outer membrane lipoprotein [Tunicatimonas pelagia]|uniref:SusD/RagB family nutrient-binding outer membrane lipoprotein n=1 Tax=Tunicatimonas pelagia TaxID=931531 RepID=UPI0026665B25|nr:SusD/RagB family nutrient-binding outer membrane lipoprotein [Tunicatimonas pelagia]WKN45205.1 SusD/RagB family nutrient-binding outer membrane lipoprotein [Tunicatimonas pelagia]